MMNEDKKLYVYTLNSKGTIVREDYLVIEETEHYVYYAQDNTQTLMAPHISKSRLDQPVNNITQYSMYSFSDKVSYAVGMFVQFIKKEQDKLHEQQNELIKKSEKLERLATNLAYQYREIEEAEREQI